MTLKVGITGGIGSGKTTVSKVFELLDVPVYYADAATKRLYNSDPELMASVKKHFGEDMYEDGKLNRSKLAAIVFADERKLHLLNKIAHPPTIKNAEQWMQQQTSPYILKEAALIFESGSGAGLDFIIGVFAPVQLRIRRVMQRDNVSEADVVNRMKQQIDEEMKMRLCDFVIYNDETQLVIPQVLKLDQTLRNMAAVKAST